MGDPGAPVGRGRRSVAGRQRGGSTVGWRGRMMALLAAVITWLAPRPVGYWLADRVGTLLYLMAGSYRRAALENVSQVLGRPTSDPLVRAAARGCFRTSARNFWDVCSLPHQRPATLLRHTSIEAAEWAMMRAALARGQGIILVTAHLGAFDYAGQLVVMLGTRPLIPTLQTTSGWIFEAVTALRSSWGGMVEPASPGLLRRMIAYLRQGGTIGLISDRDIQQNGRPVEFFGRPTTLPVGAVRMAQETGAALVTFFCPREGDGYRVLLEEVPITRSNDLEADIDANLGRLVAVLERAIQRWPDQWVIFQPVWPEQARLTRPLIRRRSRRARALG